MVIAHLTQQAVFAFQQDPYAIEVDCRNRNCYNCGDFWHLARNYRNKEIKDKIGEGRRLEYGNNEQKRTIEKENR